MVWALGLAVPVRITVRARGFARVRARVRTRVFARVRAESNLGSAVKLVCL